MALGNDENSKNSPSSKPCDTSNSFVKKIANRVTGLIGWRSNNYENTEDFNHEGLPNISLTDDETISPNPKRIKLLHNAEPRNYPSKSVTKDSCNVIQPVNDSNVAGPSFKSKCLVASTPAANYCVKNSQIHSGNVSDYLDSSVPSNISSPLPSYNTTQRHNITIPGLHRKDVSNITSYDMNKSLNETSTMMSKRRPSFNAEVFSTSNKRLSLSVCESRNRSCLSPFYSARTMYGGASALLPYSNQSGAKLRAESTSNLNVFSAKNQITIQPVPSPHEGGANDQETMSAAARKILDTLERYCSPIKDAKRIPINESSSKCEDNRTFTPRGIKRKLPSLTQITPSTTDLLRIKRQEKIQDSILNARKAVSNVPEPSTSVVVDSDSSSDSVDLDYTIFNDDTKRKDDVLQNINRKEESKYDDRPGTSMTVPKSSANTVLNLGNLPRYEITETFKFSKPLTLENFDKKVEEHENDDIGIRKPASVGNMSGSGSIVGKTTQNLSDSDQRSCLNVNATVTSKPPVAARISVNSELKSFNSMPSSSPLAASRSRNTSDGGNGTSATESTKNPLLTNKSSILSDSSSNKLSLSVDKYNTGKWTCKKCFLENSDSDCCSSCKNLRSEQTESEKNTKSVSVSVSSVDRFENKSLPSTASTGPNDQVNLLDRTSNVKNNNNKLVVNNVTIGTGFNTFNDIDRNKFNSGDDRVFGASKPATNTSDNSMSVVSGDNSKKNDLASDQSRPSDLWKSFQKAAEGKWTCGECLIKNEKTATKCVACETPNPSAPQAPAVDQDKTAENSKPKFTFGIPVTDAGSIKFGSFDTTKPATGSAFGFDIGSSAVTPVSTSNAAAQFSFGIGITTTVTNTETKAMPSYTFGTKQPDISTVMFGSSPVAFGSDTTTNNVSIDKSGSSSIQKTFETNTFNDSTTNNLKTSNPFAAAAANSSASSNMFASGATNSSKTTLLSKNTIRENGEDNQSSNTAISNDIASSSNMNSSMKKKPIMGGFPLPTSMCSGKNGAASTPSLANTFASPNGGLLHHTSTEFKLSSAGSSSLTTNNTATTLPADNLFACTGFLSAPNNSKPNDVPSFGSSAGNTAQSANICSLNSSPFGGGGSSGNSQPIIFGNTLTMGKKEDKTNVTITADGNKNASASGTSGSLFPNVNNNSNITNTVFGSGSGLSASVAPSVANNSIFGHFNSTGGNSTDAIGKSTMSTETAAASTTPMLHFNNTVPSTNSPFRFSALNSATSSPQQQQNNNQTNSGGFAFNGPKLENSMMSPKFGQSAFGASSNTNATAFGSTLNTGGVNFTFGSTSATTQADNSSTTPFSSALKTGSTQDTLLKSQISPAFAVFGSDTIKKSGGFNFTPGNQMNTSTINNFSSFASTINDNQDQNRLSNSNPTISTTPFMFGSGTTNPQTPQHNYNLTVPASFNFNSDPTTNSLPQFTASQPANTSNATVRRIKKAVRRTTTK